MRPVIKFNKKTPTIDDSFLKQFEKSPIIISVVGGLGSGKSNFIKSIFGLEIPHGPRRHQHDVFGAKRTGLDPDLVCLEWQLELHPQILKEDARVLRTATQMSDILIMMPYVRNNPIDYSDFMCRFLESTEALFVFSPCSDIEAINERAKVALSKRRVYALPHVNSPEFEKNVGIIKEAVYNEITQFQSRPLNEYHTMLHNLSIHVDEYDHSYEIDAFLEQECFKTLKQVARTAFLANIKPNLPIEEAELAIEVEKCLEGLIACGKKIVLRPTTTFSADVKSELESIFNEWKKENYGLSSEVCEKAYLEFKKQRALDPTVTSNAVKLIGPAKREFIARLAELDTMPIVSRKRKLDASQDGSAKRQRTVAEQPLKKSLCFNTASLDPKSPPEVQKMNRDLTPLKLFRNIFFRNALGETPFYRLTNDKQKIIVYMPKNKSFVEYVDAYRIDPDSGEKIQFDQATRKKIDAALLSAKQRGLMPPSALQEVVKSAFGFKASSTNGNWIMSAMGIEDDITFHFKLMEVLVNNEPRRFNKFSVKAKTRMSIIKHIVAYFKVMTMAEKEKQQEIFDAFRESCNFGNADMKNEHFELFFDATDHTTIDVPDDPTDEEPSLHQSHEQQPMEVSEDKVKVNLPIDMMGEDESLFTTGVSGDEEDLPVPSSSQYSLGNNIIFLSDDEEE